MAYDDFTAKLVSENERLRAALTDLLEFSPRDRVLAVCRAALANQQQTKPD
jgi:hypothetical protein